MWLTGSEKHFLCGWVVGAVGWVDINTKSEEPKWLYYMYKKKVSMRNERMLIGLI